MRRRREIYRRRKRCGNERGKMYKKRGSGEEGGMNKEERQAQE